MKDLHPSTRWFWIGTSGVWSSWKFMRAGVSRLRLFDVSDAFLISVSCLVPLASFSGCKAVSASSVNIWLQLQMLKGTHGWVDDGIAHSIWICYSKVLWDQAHLISKDRCEDILYFKFIFLVLVRATVVFCLLWLSRELPKVWECVQTRAGQYGKNRKYIKKKIMLQLFWQIAIHLNWKKFIC